MSERDAYIRQDQAREWSEAEKDDMTDKADAGEIERILDTVDAEIGGDMHVRLRDHIESLRTQLTAARAERDEAIKKTLGDFSEEYSALKWQCHEDGQTIHRLKNELTAAQSEASQWAAMMAGAVEIRLASGSITRNACGSFTACRYNGPVFQYKDVLTLPEAVAFIEQEQKESEIRTN